MPSLRESQERFAAALLARGIATRAIDLYRGNIAGVQRNALAASYPVVRQLVGAAFFGAMAEDYGWTHPSTSGDLNGYGHAMAEFLERYEPARPLPYLPGVAALEWALDEAARAADAASEPEAVMDRIAVLAPDELPRAWLRPHPAVRLVEASHGVLRIWRVHQSWHEGAFEAPLEPAPEWLLVTRDANGVAAERIGAAEFTWLRAGLDGAGFAEALDAALRVDDRFPLAEMLRKRIADGTFIGVLP